MENKAFILRHLFLLLLLQTFDPGCSFNLEKVRFDQFFKTTKFILFFSFYNNDDDIGHHEDFNFKSKNLIQ